MLTSTNKDLTQVEPPIPGRIAWSVVKDTRVLRLISVVCVLLAWQAIGIRIPYAISYPSAIFRAAIHTTIPAVLPSFGDTMAAFWLGLGIAIFIGVPVGLLMGRFRIVELLLSPYIAILNSTPIVALFPLFILLFGINFKLRLSVVVLTSLFPVIINTHLGVREVDRSLLDVGTAFAASRVFQLRTIVLPAVLRYIFAGIRVGFGRGLIGILVIEIEASAVGVGYLLSQDASNLRIDEFFVPLAYLGFFSILCTHLIHRTERWLTMPWTRSGVPGPLRSARWRIPRASAVGRLGQVAWKPVRAGYLSLSAKAGLPVGRRGGGADAPRRTVGTSAQAARLPDRFLSSWAGKWGVRLAGLIIVVGAWQIYASHNSAAVVPGPTAVARALWNEFFVSGSIYGPLASSCGVLLVAFALSLVIGIPVGIAMGRSRVVEHLIDPYIAWLYGLPHVAFVPIMVVWLGFGFQFRVSYAIFSAIFIVIINTMAGVKSIDPELLACGRSFCATEREIVRTIVLPGATPFIVAGARLAFSATWIGVVVAEVLATQSGLGGLITTYSNNFQMPQMAVPVVVIMAMSVLIFSFANWLQPRLTPWAKEPARTR